MDLGIPSEVSSLISKHGSMARIPQAELIKLGYVLLTNDSGVSSLVLKSEVERLQRLTEHVLYSCRGYIYAEDLVRLKRFLRGREIVKHRDLNMIQQRATEFRNAGIRRIFDPNLYAPVRRDKSPEGIPDLFPTVDYIIQVVTGIFFYRATDTAMKWKKNGKKGAKKYAVEPTTVYDVFKFRRLAFTDEGRIDPVLVKELLDYISDQVQSSDSGNYEELVTTHDYQILLFLEEKLARLKVEKKYKDWDGNVDVVKNHFWYLRYPIQLRSDIVKAYLQSLSRPVSASDRKVLNRIQLLFPALWESFGGQLRVYEKRHKDDVLVQIADEKLASSNLSSFPYRALVEEPWRSKYLNPVVDIFRSLCEALAKAKKYDILFVSALELHHHLPIPNRLSLLPECKEVLDQVRLGVIEVIPDRTLIKIFGAPNDYRGRASSIGHSRFRDESAASKALRELIGQRYKKIKMDGQKK